MYLNLCNMNILLPKPAKIPNKPGVYVFCNARKKPLYIGKAANLRHRLQSYFQANVPKRVERLRQETTTLNWEILPTEFDALIREAELIKKYRPKFNVLLRDDKSYYYIEITKEKFPHINIIHRPNTLSALGPYTESGSLYAVLRAIRRIFPYCTCRKQHTRPCLNAGIGRCLGFCCLKNADASISDLSRYKKNISVIRDMLTGKSQKLIKEFRIIMENSVKLKKYETAAEYRDKIYALENINSHKRIITERNPFVLNNAKISAELARIFGSQNPITRIEGYDASMLMGSAATASMVVFENGLPQKSEYKKFRIKTDKTQSDADMLEEVITRRLTHNEWKLPDLMLIDGGTPQLRKVARALRKKFGLKWPVFLAGISKAKNSAGKTRRKASADELLHIYGKSPINTGKLPVGVMHISQYVRDESHRFAKAYHSTLRAKITPKIV